MSTEENGRTMTRRQALGLASGALAGAALASMPRAAHAASSLPIGTWDINQNGHKGKLVVRSVDASGKVSGTVFGNTVQGFWDEDAKKITLMRIIDATNPSKIQIQTGYMFKNSSGSDAVYTLAGSFEAFSGTGGTAQRHVFGWYATIFVLG